jgi:uncharacterized protein
MSLTCASISQAQDIANDLRLLQQQAVGVKPYGLAKKKKSFNPLSILYAGTLGFYQSQVSPQWGANCAFELSCSRFSRDMVSEFGLAKGFFLSLDRMGRCNKISFFETLPNRINAQGKIIDKPQFYRAR